MSPRLKSLELHGYKTFANRTIFEFPGAVTAIVGPNGSGKSNIADALRWVLGEQSYSLLRGKKTEDMIFAGSDQRPRAGMAQATVIFDNSAQWLPIDFGEVAISRRAYRDGDNEYFLNSQRVRLKDVHELLSQSGLAERTYTIIGQGLVDAALALKAEERRQLFEEAAGIGLHRSRREEALRRLETTRRNLERVEDILAELKPRLNSLERQARKTQEYDQIKADLQLGLHEWYGYYWHRLQAELAQVREINRQQEAGLETAGSIHAELDRQLNRNREQILNLRLELNEWHRQSAEFHTARERINRELAVRDERFKYLEERFQNTGSQCSRLAEELATLEERKIISQEDLTRLTLELQEIQSQADVSQHTLESRREERSSIEAELDRLQKLLSEQTSNKAALEARQSERQSQVEGLRKTSQSANETILRLQQTVQAIEGSCEEIHSGLNQIELLKKDKQAVIEEILSRQITMENQHRERENQHNQFQADLSRIQAQIEVIDQAEQALSGYASGARLLIQAARESRLRGTQFALSNQIQVLEAYETAIAAALGEYLDAILFDDDAALESALIELEGKQARGALIPLSSLRNPDGESSIHPGKDVIGLASDFIEAPKEIRAVINLLLGQTVLVTDRQAARRVIKRIRETNQTAIVKVVTMRGEVFHPSGPVLVAQEGRSSTLSRSRQKRELSAQIAAIQSQIVDLSQWLQENKRTLQALNEEKSRENLAFQKLLKEEEAVRRSYQDQSLRLEQARHQLEWQSEQSRLITERISNDETQIGAISEQLIGLKSMISDIQAELSVKRINLANLPLDDLQSDASHWGTQAAITEKALEEVRNRLRDQDQALIQARQDLNRLERQTGEINEARQNLENEKNAFLQEENQINARLDNLRVQIEPTEKLLEQLEAEQIDLQSREARARQNLNQAEHLHAQAKINLARKQESLDALRRRIEDDFGLVAFEYADDVTGPTPLPLAGLVDQLPRVNQISPEVEETIKRQKALLRRMGPINPEAKAEYREVKERFDFLSAQVTDLHRAEEDIRQIIAELDSLMQQEFQRTFKLVAEEFRHIFSRLFGGGSARLVLTDPDDLTNTGIDIEARLPGRREQGLSLLSGGERSLTAVSLVFAILRVSPTPFCVLDEVDAMLDEANVGRFRELLKELSQETQFVIITHNRNTVQVADVLYGVTMGRDSSTQTLSLRMDEIDRVIE